jgi:hypothetical protein
VNGSSGDDWWIKKFDQNGVEDAVGWNKKISSAGRNDDVAYSCVIDSNDNVYVAGKGVNLVNGSSGNDWWIKKFDKNGVEDATNWNKKINSPDTYEDSAYSIAIAGNDDVYVAGNGGKLVSSSSGYDWWIKKFDKNGIEDTAQWDKKYNSPGSSYDFAYSIAIQENSVYVAGYGYYLTEGSGIDDWWIKKFDLNGVEDTANWDLKIDSEAGRNDIARSIAIDGNNDIYVVGSGQELIDIFSGTDWWIKKFNAIGEEQ